MIDLTELQRMMELHPNGTHSIFVEQKSEGTWMLTGETLATLCTALREACEALEWYRACGEAENTQIDECLERAFNDRADDKVTINLGGKYIAEKALIALKSIRSVVKL